MARQDAPTSNPYVPGPHGPGATLEAKVQRWNKRHQCWVSPWTLSAEFLAPEDLGATRRYTGPFGDSWTLVSPPRTVVIDGNDENLQEVLADLRGLSAHDNIVLTY